MDNTQHTYFAELKLALQKAGYTVQAVEDGHLPIEWNDRRLCQVTESGGIRFRTDDTTDPAAEAARSRVTDIAGVVREYMTLIEQAPDLKADGLGENYKLLAEFNGAVLAGHSSRYGVEFVTWEWSCGRTGLWQGHYYDPGSGPNGYLSAKQDFCVRSGLMDQHRLFTNEQLTAVSAKHWRAHISSLRNGRSCWRACRNRSDGLYRICRSWSASPTKENWRQCHRRNNWT